MSIQESKNLIEKVKEIFSSDEFATLINVAKDLHDRKKDFEKSLMQNLNTTFTGADYQKSITKILNAQLNGFSSYKIGRRMQSIDNLLDQYASVTSQQLLDGVHRLKESSEKVVDAFEKLKFSAQNNIINIYENINEFYKSYEYLDGQLQVISIIEEDLIANKVEGSEEEDRLKLNFENNNYSLDEHVNLCKMLIDAYTFSCALYSINVTTYPLKIKTYYSGSDTFDLIGAKPAIGVVSKILDKTTDYFFANYTADGEYAKISGQFDDVIKKLDLVEQLKKDGVDSMDDVSESLKNSAIQLARSLDKNISKQYKVYINGNEKPVFQRHTDYIEYQTKYLPGSNFDQSV
ncbi:hypothetical protein LFX25_20010 [Leptospira sp. FAT2]|uniref:hypothetical protein n=1 Tax=Leptospira sanjuanensis TaxID=2879643 RepID=UPI001EE7A531|nr:hypothetical protein [Leptospira sanjuanensis]MCG6195530.1 hypothetical protein [Leptospira sanjuanensis]